MHAAVLSYAGSRWIDAWNYLDPVQMFSSCPFCRKTRCMKMQKVRDNKNGHQHAAEVTKPGAPSSVLAPSSDALVTSSFLLLVVRPGAPSSVLVPSSDALCS